MDERLVRTIASLATLDELRTFDSNARQRNALSTEIDGALKRRATILCRSVVAQRTGLDLATLTPAEEKIVEAVAEYVAIKNRQGSHAQRTLNQVKKHGLIGAAEAAVCRSKPTMGFTALAEADKGELSY